MVGTNNSFSGDPFSSANFAAELAKRNTGNMKGNLEQIETGNDPIREALKSSEKLAEIEARLEDRKKGEAVAAQILNYQAIGISESSENNQKLVNISDIKTHHNFSTESTPTESLLKLRSNAFGLEKLESIENKIFDRKIIRDERSIPIRIEDEIRLAESEIKLKVSIQNGTKSIRVFEKNQEKEELKFQNSQINDKQRVEVPSFSPASINSETASKTFFHKKPLKPYADKIPTYTAETEKYKISVDKGIIAIREQATNDLLFLQDGEGRNYIFHPEAISETDLTKSKNELSKFSSIAAIKDTLAARAGDLNKLLEVFKEHNNPDQLRIKFSEPNPEGKSEAIVNREDLKKELIEIQKQILGISLNAFEFLERGKELQKSASPDKDQMILNPKQTVAMYADSDGGLQYFNAQAKSLYQII